MGLKLDEKAKSRKNLKQQIKHTKERMGDAEFAMEQNDISPERKQELQMKNKHRKEDIENKNEELE